MSGTEIAIAIVVGLVTLPYWFGPILIRLVQKSNARPGYRLVSLDSSDDGGDEGGELTPEVEIFFKQTIVAMQDEGFVERGVLYAGETETGNVRIAVVLFENTRTGDVAVAVAMHGKIRDQWKLQAKYVEIATKLPDEREFDSNNSDVLNPFPPVSGKEVEQFPGLESVARLHLIHRELLRARGLEGAPRKRLPPNAEPVAIMQAATEKGLGQHVPSGYLWLDETIGAYRPTWKGAWILCWRLLPPMSWVLRRRMRARAEELLGRLPV